MREKRLLGTMIHLFRERTQKVYLQLLCNDETARQHCGTLRVNRPDESIGRFYSDFRHMYAQMNRLGADRRPFIALISAFADYGWIFQDSCVTRSGVMWDFRGKRNFIPRVVKVRPQIIQSYPPDKDTYRQAFDAVMREQREGQCWLLNLSFSTPVCCNMPLCEMFHASRALYRFCFPGRFVFFSPEPFVRIEKGRIHTYPMKGTIDASLENAELLLLEDPKEAAEHLTVVDLLRNDLSRVSGNVHVQRYRYVERISGSAGDILQTSSHITGTLDNDWHNSIGDIFSQLLPAGSVTGAPKRKTVELIRTIENHDRGFYAGVALRYDGTDLDSTVCIRFIEQNENALKYKSGGGITIYSNCDSEYAELRKKVYIPYV
ncbi:MAG: aminodeoxychorismate synthase component I [Candidatus Latescibacteria bacterium]|nr:aminodeoxychorismate synthase component I [Candidatus Latescibacterota bacterium]